VCSRGREEGGWGADVVLLSSWFVQQVGEWLSEVWACAPEDSDGSMRACVWVLQIQVPRASRPLALRWLEDVAGGGLWRAS
jgi:hypothetical protein